MMKKNKKIALVLGLVTVVVGGIVVFAREKEPGRLDTFAQCLSEKKAVFYGAFWCPHCRVQKQLFGSSEKYLTYVECSTPDGQAQKQTCIDKRIESYPTWEFADGSRELGEVALSKLAEKTGCPLPE
ncbi:MAG TPA: hypothetical protein VEA18_01085 [Candidatus Kapabacteria bacterium]|nr:hypothetical protein [Candidatus Kapabacteria bacterium]